jgi:hypothetical protein
MPAPITMPTTSAITSSVVSWGDGVTVALPFQESRTACSPLSNPSIAEQLFHRVGHWHNDSVERAVLQACACCLPRKEIRLQATPRQPGRDGKNAAGGE